MLILFMIYLQSVGMYLVMDKLIEHGKKTEFRVLSLIYYLVLVLNVLWYSFEENVGILILIVLNVSVIVYFKYDLSKYAKGQYKHSKSSDKSRSGLKSLKSEAFDFLWYGLFPLFPILANLLERLDFSKYSLFARNYLFTLSVFVSVINFGTSLFFYNRYRKEKKGVQR